MNVNVTNRQDNVPISNQRPEGKKCHGNRRDQRFRKKCRARKLKPAKIEKKLIRQKQIWDKKNSTTSIVNNTNDNTMTIPVSTNISNRPTTITTINFNKRKRDISLQELNINQTIGNSNSLISLAPPSLKRRNKENPKIIVDSSNIIINNNIMNMNYRFVIL
jgi:hypothetical protein